jgi:hypothetical protein
VRRVAGEEASALAAEASGGSTERSHSNPKGLAARNAQLHLQPLGPLAPLARRAPGTSQGVRLGPHADDAGPLFEHARRPGNASGGAAAGAPGAAGAAGSAAPTPSPYQALAPVRRPQERRKGPAAARAAPKLG